MAGQRGQTFVVMAVLAVAGAAEGALPNRTLAVLHELWMSTGGVSSNWTRCQWFPGMDPCAPPVGLPQWAPPSLDVDDDDGYAWSAQVCFVCDSNETGTDQLVGIDLGSNNGTGTIPSSIGQLQSLRYLGLNRNNFSGSIPASLDQLENLTHLDLSQNQLSGPLPSELCNLTMLSQLVLSENLLTGAIPVCIGTMTSLAELALGANRLTGTIPESIVNLTALAVLQLYENRLSGPIPNSIGNLKALTNLELFRNSLDGPIPESVGNLTALTELILSVNRLTGSIPPSIGRLSALLALDFGDNSLFGPIPEILCNLTLLTFVALSDNNLAGAIPDCIGNLTGLTQLYLFSNNLAGSIPDSIGNLTALNFLILCNNNLAGPIPQSICNLTALTFLELYNNNLSGSIPESIGNLTALTVLSLYTNNLSGSIPDSIGNLTALTALFLYNNSLSGSIPDSIGDLAALQTLDLNSNELCGGLPTSIGRLTLLTILALGKNNLSGPIPSEMDSLTQLTLISLGQNGFSEELPDLGNLSALTSLDVSTNRLSGSIPESFGHLRQLTVLDLSDNNLFDALGGSPALFRVFQGSLSVNLANNNITYLGQVFAQCTGLNGDMTVNLTGNHIDSASLERALTSSRLCGSSLKLIANANNVTHVDFSTITRYTQRYCTVDPCPRRQQMSIFLDLSWNPISSLVQSDLDTPPSPPNFNASYTTSITLDLSDSTATIALPTSFSFAKVAWDPDGHGKLTLRLNGNPNVDIGIVRILSGAHNPPQSLSVDLSRNNYTTVATGTFHKSTVTFLNLSHNAITLIADDAFQYNFYLSTLDLSWNHLTVLSIPFLDKVPGLSGILVHHNRLLAIPQTNNYIANIAHAASNPITCTVYGPKADNCTCPVGYQNSTAWNYVRCTATRSGCPRGHFWNSSNQSIAPWSDCVNGSLPGYYFVDNTLRTLTNCSTYLKSTGRRAYEVQGPLRSLEGTATSDRICSICSDCPAGYTTVPCTQFVNTKCNSHLMPWEYAVIVAVFVTGLVAAFCAGYGRTQKRKRHRTQNELELTERLLGDVQDENERVTEEIADMEQAWVIRQADLKFGEVIGEGAYGSVFRGTWGHIPVAIKVLRQPLDNMGQSQKSDFDREVKFMRSIRHPHILIFYGAGVDDMRKAYLVTELMAGSLRALLLNHTKTIAWESRLLFTKDIAEGMAYLHNRGTIHRDLKADNCFLSETHRVKVADFGTGRIAKHIQDRGADEHPNSFPSAAEAWSSRSDDDRNRTLSKGVGSLLWMAPEALRGARLTDTQGQALDVYSYTIVLWEIWTRSRPWDEVQGTGIKFVNKLTDLVNAGVRPKIPDGCEPAPVGYEELMNKCWVGRPDRRPTFESVLSTLTLMNKPVKSRMETPF